MRRFRAKARRLLQLYSRWQETRQDDLQQKCLGLLSEILVIQPTFNLRQEFQEAF
ncbi:MAG: hypothetical protein Q8R76_03095 [Candidatus Omnitrophota bacterium]|nr:hypothetical protein [Candidatus Omnitrophota bacterium]